MPDQQVKAVTDRQQKLDAQPTETGRSSGKRKCENFFPKPLDNPLEM